MTDGKVRERICFRIRKIDADLRDAVTALTDTQLSELARDGLRLILGLRTTKRVEVTEKVIIASTPGQRKAAEVRSTPAVFIPPHKRTQ